LLHLALGLLAAGGIEPVEPSTGALTCDPPGHLGARPESEFAQDVLDVHVDGALADDQVLGHVAIAQSIRH
jgi:hypothetical protein